MPRNAVEFQFRSLESSLDISGGFEASIGFEKVIGRLSARGAGRFGERQEIFE